MGDFHEIGVDVMNISQPNVVEIPRLGQVLKGRQCFMLPISYQTVSISGTPEEIRAALNDWDSLAKTKTKEQPATTEEKPAQSPEELLAEAKEVLERPGKKLKVKPRLFTSRWTSKIG